MNKQQALRLARARFGKRARVDHDPRGCDESGRAYAKERLASLQEEKPERPGLCEECRRKRRAYFKASGEFEKKESHWRSRALSYRYEIVTVSRTGLGDLITVCGKGDSWEEAAEAAGLL